MDILCAYMNLIHYGCKRNTYKFFLTCQLLRLIKKQEGAFYCSQVEKNAPSGSGPLPVLR